MYFFISKYQGILAYVVWYPRLRYFAMFLSVTISTSYTRQQRKFSVVQIHVT